MFRNLVSRIRPRNVKFSTFRMTQQKSMNLKDKNQAKPEESTERDGLLRIPEQLTNQSSWTSTRAENQLDTMRFYDLLIENGFKKEQSESITALLLKVLNDQFFSSYNKNFLKNTELDNQSHLFHAAETELKFVIQNSRETHLNEQHLQLMKLLRDADSLHDEINGLIINLLKKDSKVDFNNQKTENTLLQRQIKMELNNCSHKITTKILGNTRSDIENFRWQTTRSGVLAIIILVFMITGGVSFSKRIAASNSPVQITLHTVDPEEAELDEEEIMDE